MDNETKKGTLGQFAEQYGLTVPEGQNANRTVEGYADSLNSSAQFTVPKLNEPLGTVFNAPTPISASTPYQDIDEDKVKRDVLQSYQGQLNATKGAFAQLLAETKQQGIGRLGESTAQQARGGLLGSDFGQAQTDKTRAYNLSQERDVLRSQASAIAGIMAQANADARQAIQDKRAAKQYGYESLKAYNAEEATRKATNLANLANSFLLKGVDPSTLGKQLKDIAKSYGVTENDILNSYLESKTAKDQADAEAEAERQLELQKELSFNLSEGQARYQYNPETGQVELVAQRAKTYAPKASSSATGDVFNLTSKQQTTLNSVINKYSADSTIQQGQQVRQMRNIAEMIKQNPESAGNQLISLYTIVKSLDPESVVREGEIALASKANTYLGQIGDTLTRIGQGRVINPEVAKQLADATLSLSNEWLSASQRREQQYKSQANVFGLQEPFNAYIGGFEGVSTIEPMETSGQTIQVRSPDGQIGEIPAEDLEQALAEGYIQL